MHLSNALQKYRTQEMLPDAALDVVGEAEDLRSTRQLAAEDKYQCQQWALSLIKARPHGGEIGSKTGKKGADQGIDGVITFIDDASGKPKRAIVQVKGGHVTSTTVRDFHGTVDRVKDAIGVLTTLESATRPMETEAAAAGFYESPGWGQKYPRLQILTIEQLLRGAQVQMPPAYGTFKQAQKVKKDEGTQSGFDLGV